MTNLADIRVGTAGWSIPRASAARFESEEGTHLQRYSRWFRCAEINSSFHRPHAASTYAKWRDSAPPGFRFAVKVPRTITHVLKLVDAREPLIRFLAETEGLGGSRGPLLVQLPPSLAFKAAVAVSFFELLRTLHSGPVVCEPRHPTWFERRIDALLEHYAVSRVCADPPPVPAALEPGGFRGLAYFRLHGAPRTYWSTYSPERLAALAETLRSTVAREVWCVFDNTASGAALENAWELRAALDGACTSPSG